MTPDTLPGLDGADRTMTAEEYLVFEREVAAPRDEKYEFEDGRLIAMHGGTLNHNRIATNLIHGLGILLPRDRWDLATGSLKLRIDAANAYYYPDVAVARRGPDGHAEVMAGPVLVAEVLSPTTQRRDRSRKRENYRSVPSIEEILLIAQDRRRVEHDSRATGNWSRRIAAGSDRLVLDAIGLTLDLDDLYRTVDV